MVGDCSSLLSSSYGKLSVVPPCWRHCIYCGQQIHLSCICVCVCLHLRVCMHWLSSSQKVRYVPYRLAWALPLSMYTSSIASHSSDSMPRWALEELPITVFLETSSCLLFWIALSWWSVSSFCALSGSLSGLVWTYCVIQIMWLCRKRCGLHVDLKLCDFVWDVLVTANSVKKHILFCAVL